MSILQGVAEDVTGSLKSQDVDLYDETGNEYGSIIVILMIISIVVSILRLIQGCRKENEVQAMAADPSWFERLIIRKHCYAALRRFDGAYPRSGKALAEAIIERGSRLSPDEIGVLFEEVDINNTPSLDVSDITDEAVA